MYYLPQAEGVLRAFDDGGRVGGDIFL